MGNDIEIRVRVSNQTAAGLNQINTALRTLTTRATAAAVALARLEREAVGAARALEDLQHQAAQTAAAMTLLSRSVNTASNNLNRFNQRAETANTRIRDLSDGATSLQGDFDRLGGAIDGVNGGLGDLRGSFGRITVAGDSASSSLGGGGGAGSAGGGLKGSLIGIGAAVGASVLPSLGALSPMLFGLAGVGGAAALAMDDLKKEFKKLKPEFEDLQKVASKAVMPGVKKSMDDWRGALKGLNPVVKGGGEAFGDFVERAADFANSPAFKSSLLKNVEMGSRFFGDFTDSLFDFTQAFLDFGTKSQPSLDAFQNLFGGMLDRGLPGMFKEMEQGIGGSADVIDGLAYLLNDALLPSIGKIAGAFADSFGPLTKEMLITAGNQIKLLATAFDVVAEALEPLADFVADAFRAWNELFTIGASVAGSFAKEVGGALLDSLAAVAGVDTSQLDDGFHGLSDWVKSNQGAIREGLLGIAQAITSMVITGIEAMPKLFGAFRFMTEGILTAIDGLVSTLAGTFGELPGVGEIFKSWNDGFDEMAGGFREDMDNMGSAIDGFVDEAVPRLNRSRLTMNVDQAEASLEHIKQQLKDPELTKERKAKLTADKEEAEAKLAAAKRELADFDKKQAKAKLDAEPSSFWGKIRAAITARIPKKTGLVDANTGPFRNSVGGIIGRVLGTAYIDVQRRIVESSASPRFEADGGVMRFYANGGTENHVAQIAPAGAMRVWAERETGGEAYIPLAESKRPRSMAILEEVADQFGYRLEKFAGGGMSQTMRDARNSLRDQFGLSHFGRMAGYGRTPFEKALGAPADLGALVSALNAARGDIKRATSGGTESRLLRMLNSVGSGLIKYEKNLTRVNASLEKAKSKLDDLRSSASQLRDSVKSGVLSAASITRGASGDKPMTVGSIMGGLTSSRDKATAFADALKRLTGMGLDKGLLRQIAEAGIEGGGLETAGALLGASSSEIQSLNDLQAQIAKAAGSAGSTAADAFYGAAIRAQDKLVKSLQKQQDRLEKAMDRLAKTMEKAISRAIGGKAAGGIIGAASGGARGGLTWVGEQGPELVRMPYGSRVYSNPDSRRMAAAAGGQPIVIHQTITLDGRVLAQQMFDPLRGVIHRRGGLKALER